MAIRFRRHDQYNFVRESSKVQPAVFESGPYKGKPNPRAGETTWEIEGFYSRLDWMVRAALEAGVGGDSIKELGESLEKAKKEVCAAISEAIASGALSMTAYTAKIAQRKPRAPRRKKEEAEA